MQDKKTVLLHIAVGCTVGSLVAVVLGATLNQVILPALLGGLAGFFSCGAKESWQVTKEKIFHPISSTKAFRQEIYDRSRIVAIVIWAVGGFFFIPYFTALLLLAALDPSVSSGDLYALSALSFLMGTVMVGILTFGARVVLIEFYDEKMHGSKECQRFPISWFGVRVWWKIEDALDNLNSKSQTLKKLSSKLDNFFDEDYFSKLFKESSKRKTSFLKVCQLLGLTFLLMLSPIALVVVVIYIFLENVVSIILILAINKRVATFSGVVVGSIVAKILEYSYAWDILATALMCWLTSLVIAYTMYFLREYLGRYEEWWEDKHCTN